MCRLIESIKVENRQFAHIQWHNKRFNNTRNQLFGISESIDLSQMIVIPKTLNEGVYKCRIIYQKEVENVSFEPYIIRSVKTLKLVTDNTIDYPFKYENRKSLLHLMEQKGSADDILIVKNGCITDTSYSNIAFFDGKKWYTPDTYLLNGTHRQRLLAEGILKEKRITPDDLPRYIGVKPINAMLDFEKTDFVQIQQD
jgi:4-amino-4-deoxychorismate lyase